MPCRVGITTQSAFRRTEWERKVIGLTNWRIIGTHNTRDAAQAQETIYARTHGCTAHGGGRQATGLWIVYRFDYVRTRRPRIHRS